MNENNPSSQSHDNDSQSPINWDDFFRNNNARLKLFIAKRVSNYHDVQDIAQTTYMEAIKCSAHFSGRSKIETWVCGIALNVIRNHYRLNKKNSLNEVLNQEAFYDELKEVGPDLLHEHASMLDRTIKNINNLPEDLQEIMEILITEGGSYSSISHIQKIPIGTVRSRLFRIRHILKSNDST